MMNNLIKGCMMATMLEYTLREENFAKEKIAELKIAN